MPAEALARMNRDAMVFAMANPNPEVHPEEAAPYVRIMATGRSDYPNQINNVLCFPGIFRGALDVRAPAITEEMKMAAARAIAAIVDDNELREDYIIPSVFNRDVAPAVAAAVAEQARAAGTAQAGQEVGYAHGDTIAGGSAGTAGSTDACERLTAGRPIAMPARDRHGATGLIGAAAGRRAARARSGRSRSSPAIPSARARALGDVEADPLGADRRAGAGRGARGAATRSCTSPASPVAQRWSAEAKRAIRDSRVIGTRNLSPACAAAREPRARGRSSAPRRSATTARAARSRSTRTRPRATTSWRRCASPGRREAAARGASSGMRVVQVRTGVVLDRTRRRARRRCCRRSGSASAARSPAGASTCPGSTPTDVVGMMLAALDDERWSGPVNATAPEPVTNRDFSQALGRVLGPPGAAARARASRCALLYGEMAEIVTTGARVRAGQAARARLRVRPSASSSEALRAALSSTASGGASTPARGGRRELGALARGGSRSR